MDRRTEGAAAAAPGQSWATRSPGCQVCLNQDRRGGAAHCSLCPAWSGSSWSRSTAAPSGRTRWMTLPSASFLRPACRPSTPAGRLVVGRQQRLGLDIAAREDPEVLGRDRCRQDDLVGLAAVEKVAGGVAEGGGIGRAGAGARLGHRRRDPGRVVEEYGARIEQPLGPVGELVAAADERRQPETRESSDMEPWTPVSRSLGSFILCLKVALRHHRRISWICGLFKMPSIDVGMWSAPGAE